MRKGELGEKRKPGRKDRERDHLRMLAYQREGGTNQREGGTKQLVSFPHPMVEQSFPSFLMV